MIKPAYGLPIDETTYKQTLAFFDRLMTMLHPFMPFLTEEIWHLLNNAREGKSLMFETHKNIVVTKADENILKQFAFASEIIMGVRTIRNEKNISPKIPITLFIKKNGGERPDLTFDDIAKKICNLENLQYTKVPLEKAFTFVVGTTECYIQAQAENIDIQAELAKAKEELSYAEGFLQSVTKKLANANFVGGAPAQVVENERKKQSDAQQRIVLLKTQIEQWEKTSA